MRGGRPAGRWTPSSLSTRRSRSRPRPQLLGGRSAPRRARASMSRTRARTTSVRCWARAPAKRPASSKSTATVTNSSGRRPRDAAGVRRERVDERRAHVGHDRVGRPRVARALDLNQYFQGGGGGGGAAASAGAAGAASGSRRGGGRRRRRRRAAAPRAGVGAARPRPSCASAAVVARAPRAASARSRRSLHVLLGRPARLLALVLQQDHLLLERLELRRRLDRTPRARRGGPRRARGAAGARTFSTSVRAGQRARREDEDDAVAGQAVAARAAGGRAAAAAAAG